MTRSQTKAARAGFKKIAKPFVVEQKKPEAPQVIREPIDEVDRHDLHSPKYCAEYVGDIYKHYKSVEHGFLPPANYMDEQSDINERMRALLIDWLCQVHNKFELVPATLYLTVNILDRFLAKKPVSRRRLQLVGCASMLLASKYEEIYAPELKDFVSMSDNAFTCEDLLRMEGVILNVLKFTLTVPTVYKFLRRYMKIAGSSVIVQHHATYLIERTLQEYSMIKYPPSIMAAAALNLANRSNDVTYTWNEDLNRLSGYGEEDFLECECELVHVVEAGEKNYLQGVRKKYLCSRYMSVAQIDLEAP